MMKFIKNFTLQDAFKFILVELILIRMVDHVVFSKVFYEQKYK